MHKKRDPIPFLLFFYVICFVLRLFEYFVLRTDQTILGEAFVHKLLGFALLAFVLPRMQLSFKEIGFARKGAWPGLLFGTLLGVIPLAVAYAVEFVLLRAGGSSPSLALFVSSYSITGNTAMESGALFLLICILGNVINVVMEEGVFRGLFLKLGDRRLSSLFSMLLSALLFGIWHIAGPLRAFADGQSSAGGTVMASLMQILLTGLSGFMLCMLARLTRSLWAPMAAHFVNNFSSNVLHVLTATGMDEWQVIRLSIAQTLTFLFVLALYLRSRFRQKRQNRQET